MRPDSYSFRDEDDLSENRLENLTEDVKSQRGIHTPLLVRVLPDGRFLLLDGHRRFTVLGILVRQQVEGFHADMLVPAVVITSDCTELDMLAMLASSNIQRQSLDA
jgi:ParB-like chromosome segregation protein Spo0J